MAQGKEEVGVLGMFLPLCYGFDRDIWNLGMLPGHDDRFRGLLLHHGMCCAGVGARSGLWCSSACVLPGQKVSALYVPFYKLILICAGPCPSCPYAVHGMSHSQKARQNETPSKVFVICAPLIYPKLSVSSDGLKSSEEGTLLA